MRFKVFFVIIVVLTMLCCLPLSLSAETVLSVPGGTVKNEEELIAALGGEDAVMLKDGHLLLRSDVVLQSPIVITEGKYVLLGAGCQISASFDDASLLILQGGKGASLSLGTSTATTDSDSLIFDGKTMTRGGALISVGEDCELNIYAGTVFLDAVSSVGGGALYNEGTVTMYDGRMENCRSLTSGGAIFNKGEIFLASGKVTTSTAELGGALYNEGKAKLVGTEFHGCRAEKGGCVFNAGELECVSSTLAACTAKRGGAIYNLAQATLSGGQILSCVSEEGEGGGVYNEGALTCRGTYFEGNSAKFGGSIYNTSSLTISEGRIYGGNATYGGNVYQASGAEMTLSGGVLSGGKATVGGGVFNEGTLRLTGGSIYFNKATYGPGVMNQGTLTVSERGHIDFDNAVFIPLTEDNAHAIILEGNPLATKIAALVPGRITENGYEASYELGATLVVGSDLSEYSGYFMIKSEIADEYLLTSSGALGKPIPFYEQLWFYLTLIAAFVVTVALIAVCMRWIDQRNVKNHEKRS